jgi:hypothetical protein
MLLAGVLGFGVLAPFRAWSDVAPDEVEANRVRLLKLRDDPVAYAELMRQAGEFLRLPEERREQLVQLDSEFRRQDPARQARLKVILQRYTAWRQRLGEDDRQRLHDAPTAADRLRLVRELRERDWVRRFSKAQRDQIARLPNPERTALIHKIRQERQRQKEEWQLAFRFWDELHMKKPSLPTRLDEMPSAVQAYFKEYLRPHLSQEELASLTTVEGNWPNYPRKLLELADRHPLALPGPTGPKYPAELPAQVKEAIRKGFHYRLKDKLKPEEIDKLFEKRLRREEGKWPAYGTMIAGMARVNKAVLPFELFASRYADLSPPTRQFLKQRLEPALTPGEKKRLAGAIGAWPRFPQAIQELTAKHGLRVPWQSLPGSPEAWNRYRLDPPVPVSMLWQTPWQASSLLFREP